MEVNRYSDENKIRILRKVLMQLDEKYKSARFKVDVHDEYGYAISFKFPNGKVTKFEVNERGEIGVIE